MLLQTMHMFKFYISLCHNLTLFLLSAAIPSFSRYESQVMSM